MDVTEHARIYRTIPATVATIPRMYARALANAMPNQLYDFVENYSKPQSTSNIVFGNGTIDRDRVSSHITEKQQNIRSTNKNVYL